MPHWQAVNGAARRSRAYIASRYEWVPDWQHRYIPSGNAFDVLTPRQRLLLLGLTAGMTVQDVAIGLDLSRMHVYREVQSVQSSLTREPTGQQWRSIIWVTEET